jgi:mRNA interferase YafQ
MYKIIYSNNFERDLKRLIKRGYAISYLKNIIKILNEEGNLPIIYRPHKLKGEFNGFWECHIKSQSSDWLLIYQKDNKDIILVRTGTHSDLF